MSAPPTSDVSPAAAELPTVLTPAPKFGYVESRYSARTSRNAGRLLLAVLVIALVELGAFGGTYLFHSRFYVSTDNAQVDADQIKINAPSGGQLVGWRAEQGSVPRRGQVLGSVHGIGGGRQANQLIRMPEDGTIGLSAVGDGTYVQRGQMLAVAVDLARVYVTARVAESDIGRVAVGDQVSVYLDAYPGRVVAGVVTDIRDATAGDLGIYPSPDVDPTNLQKIDQYVPVRIAPYPTDIPLYPGLNATVEIHTGP